MAIAGPGHTGWVRRARILIAVLCAAAAGGGTWMAFGASGKSTPAPAADTRGAAPAPAEQPPLPKARPKLVQPVAGETSDASRAPAVAVEEDTGSDRAPKGPASSAKRRPGVTTTVTGGVNGATALPNGVALPPLEAPWQVLRIIEAGNVIARSPYKWGGGHGKWVDTGYDCSGSVSFALAAAGFLDGPLASGPLMKWGEPGPGKWITIYSSPGHVYMEVAGLRFDTSGAGRTGSRWQNDLRGKRAGFVARHPSGL